MIPAAARGTTTVSARAVARIAQQAATETPNAVGTVRGTATVRGQRAEVSVRLGLPWPADLGRRAGEVQRHVASRTGELTGLSVRVARLRVVRLQRPTGGTAVFETTAPATTEGRVPRRWWSARPTPVVVAALLGAAAAGLLTADMASVRLFGNAPAAWRTGLVDRLAATSPAAGSVTVTAAAMAVAGLWLLLLACTPGLRKRYVVAGFGAGRSIALDRAAVASVVRDRVLDTDGVDSVRVRVGRRRVRVRADLAFGDRAAAREQAGAAARAALADCRLNRPLRVGLRLRTTSTWDPSPPVPGAPSADAPDSVPVPVPAGGADGGAERKESP
ncbi:DUF6286 domain-containing protein [Streptomyces globisporus]|uniref:DUF6286 domain-containing protein n=1 Tax=Streptomyces globisporus TaxID=1908 RepID=UPI00367DF8DB|nr:DUF6286 domain-containing protein [Streptomyces globisporus]